MFVRTVKVEWVGKDGSVQPCPIAWIDNFAMRNFTNDAIFDDTLPVGDGVMEIGNRVPMDHLVVAMGEWFRRKGYLKGGGSVRVTEIAD